MIYWELFYSFFKIGLFSFGGGYAMLPFIQSEIARHGWLSAQEFIDIIAVSEMTPGPIAVNSATFVGYRCAGVLGGAAATLGVALPSLIIILAVSGLCVRLLCSPFRQRIFYGVRPVVAGLVAAACAFVARTALFYADVTADAVRRAAADIAGFVNFPSLVIMALAFFALAKWKAHPILILFAAGAAGIALYSAFPSWLPG